MERISKNFIWMAAANAAGSVFSIAIFIYLARKLEPTAFGYFSYAQTLIFYLMNFVDLGLATYGIREIAKNKARASEYVSEIVSFRILVAVVLLTVLMAAVVFVDKGHTIKVLLMGSSLMLFSSALASEWAFQGLEKMHMVFASFFSVGAMQLALFYLMVKGPDDLLIAPLAYVAAYVPVIVIFLRRLRFKPLLRIWDLKRIGTYLTSSLVIWCISIFAQVYNNFDIVILGFFRQGREVGDFTIARRVVGGIAFLLVFLANAALPRFSSSFHANDMVQFKHSVRKFVKLGAALTVLLFLPAIIFGKYIILATVGSRYLEARLPLGIMMAGLVLVLFNLPFSTALIAISREKDVLAQTLASAAMSVALNLFFMPRYGMVGASISFFLAEVLGLVWILMMYDRRINRAYSG